ncbi:MAG: hypothetical protein M1821_008498 [Bathelium mastoideum]|nr:MAG: hypothetical protein M1821_008498 [Bathelium mastoideum]
MDYGLKTSSTTPASDSPHATRSGRTLNASGDARVVNASVGGIRVDKQDFQFEDRSRVSTTNNNQNTFHLQPRSRTWSSDPVASFLQNFSSVPDRNGPVEWHEPSRAFCSPEDREQQTKADAQNWETALPVVESLNKVVLDLQHKWSGRPKKRKERSSRIVTWTQLKDDIDKEIKRAREYYKHGDRKQSDVGDAIRSIKQNIGDFFVWLEWLDADLFKNCMGEVIKCVLSAVANEQELDMCLLDSMSTIMSLFSDSSDYLELCQKRRLTTSMMNESLEIFKQTAGLFVTLLERSLLPSSQRAKRGRIDSSLECLQNSLKGVDRDARANRQRHEVITRVDRGNGSPRLHIVNNYFNFLGSHPELTYNKEMMPHHDKHSNAAFGHRQKRRKGAHEPELSDRSPEKGPSIPTLLEYLKFRPEYNSDDLEECLTFDFPSKQRRKLSALTQQSIFQDWLKDESQSTALVIYGNMDYDDQVSPISYLAARIGKQYYRKDGFIVLSYICGLHDDLDAVAILARITGQLLSQVSQAQQAQPLLSSEIVSRHEEKGLKKRDPETLAAIFANVIRQLRSYRVIVFCLIDSISIYENGEGGEHTRLLLSTLSRLVESMRGRRRNRRKDKMVFKLLISEGSRSSGAHGYFKDKELLEIDEADEASEDGFEDGIGSENGSGASDLTEDSEG